MIRQNYLTDPYSINPNIKIMTSPCKISFLSVMSIIGLAACSNEKLSDIPNEPNETQSSEIRFHLNTNDFTRADNHDSDIKTLHLAFYKSGATTPSLITVKKATLSGEPGNYTVKAEFSPIDMPDMVVAYANIDDLTLIETGLFTTTTDKVILDDGYPIMSSATYFTNTESNEIAYFSKLTPDNISGKDPVNIYLDRLAAKVQVKKASEIGLTDVKAIDKDNNNITLSINADDMKWGILATDKSTYLLKKVENKSYEDYAKLLSLWKTPDKWNDTEKHTFHWANSVNHGTSFNSEKISSLAVKDITTGLGVDPIYTHETTRSGEETAKVNARPSIVISAQYYKSDNTPANTFFRYRSGGKDRIYTDAADFIAEVEKAQRCIYTKEEGSENPTLANPGSLTSMLTLSHPSADITSTDGTEFPAQYLSPQINTESFSNYCDASGKSYENAADINKALFAQFNVIEEYNAGKCVFIIPIEHINGENPLYGLVRNHSYTLTLKSIAGFGRGVAKEDSPISDMVVPGLSDSYTINASLQVNDWTEITQEIDISNQ